MKFVAKRMCVFCHRSFDLPTTDEDWSTVKLDAGGDEYWRCPSCTLRDAWRRAARQRMRHDDLTDVNPLEAAADAAVRVVLNALLDKAAVGGDLDDGIWYERFKALLGESG